MQTHLLKTLPRRLITASSMGLCLLALPAVAQTFPIPDSPMPPEMQKPTSVEKSKAQKDLEAENEALKRQLEQARKETDVTKAQAVQVAAPSATSAAGITEVGVAAAALAVAAAAAAAAAVAVKKKLSDQALKRQLEQARKEADTAKAAKAQGTAAQQKRALDRAKAQAAHVAAPPAAVSATAAGKLSATAAAAVAEKLPELEGFVLLPDGIARDKKTGLEWMRCSLGQTWDGNTCQGEAKKFTFDEAEQAAKDLNAKGDLAGKTKWRVPTNHELRDLSMRRAQGIFSNTNTQRDLFWSSSLWGNTSDALFVEFDNGDIFHLSRDCEFHVRLVR